VHPPKPKRGRIVSHEFPAWGPLFKLAPDLVGEFVWAYEVELEDGTRLQAYEHRGTQRYLHLDHWERAFVLVWSEDREGGEDPQYEEADSSLLLELALGKLDERATLFRQNISKRSQRIGWARSATKHRISKSRSRHALDHCLAIFEEDPPAGNPMARAPRWVFLGEDLAGIALEIIAVRTDHKSLMVIHAMTLRSRYRRIYEEVRRCNK